MLTICLPHRNVYIAVYKLTYKANTIKRGNPGMTENESDLA